MSKYYFECTNCSKTYEPDKIYYLCPDCEKKNTENKAPKGVLKTLYNYSEIRKNYNIQSIYDKMEYSMFLELFPVNSIDSFPKLKVGKTPIYKLDDIDNKKINFNLYIKDDSQNPTFSFKDRASYLVSAFAKENNINTIIAASTGNAGSSLAGICASQKQKAIVFVPASAPLAKLTQIVMYGAKIIPIKGTYDDAYNLSIEATKQFGWYNRNTAFNPFTIEGKKTVSYELFYQFGHKIPDIIFVSVGDGVIISGVYKGFEDLLRLKIIHKIPKIIAVQANGSNNIVSNINSKKFVSKPSKTIADSISVDIPRNFYLTKQYLEKFNGGTIQVCDNEIILASKKLCTNIGVFSEPAASAAFAGLLKYREENTIDNNTNMVVLLTGSGLKDIEAVRNTIDIPKAINPKISELI